MGEVAAAAVALLVYPGLLAVLAVGLIADWAGGHPGPDLRRLLRRPPLAVLAAALLGALAAAQSGAPFNALTTVDRNVLVAVVAILAAAGLGFDQGWSRRAPMLMAGLAAVVTALLLPAVLTQDMHTDVLGGLALGPLKAAAAVLYLVGASRVVEAAGDAVRRWLWLPLGALFASVFGPAASDDAVGLAVFFGTTLVALAIILAMAAAARRLTQLSRP